MPVANMNLLTIARLFTGYVFIVVPSALSSFHRPAHPLSGLVFTGAFFDFSPFRRRENQIPVYRVYFPVFIAVVPMLDAGL